MKIGVDIDNVLNDLGPLVQKRVAEHFGRPYTMREIYRDYYLRNSLGISRWEEMIFWQKYGLEISFLCEPKPYCRQALLWLKNHGFTLHIITARPLLMKWTTQTWLEKHQIPFDHIDYGCENKGEECVKHNIPIMIEDASHNIMGLLEKGIYTIAFPYLYNLHLRHKKLIHIGDWRNIAYFLMKISKSFRAAL